MLRPHTYRASKVRDELLPKIIELHQKGLSDLQIGVELGQSGNSIQRYRTRYTMLPAQMPENTYHCEEDRVKGYMIRNIKHSAKRRGLEFDLTYHDLKLPTHCPLLEIPLVYRHEAGNFNDLNRATLDRIDNSKGYVRGNVWIISRLANNMKSASSFDQLELFAKNALKFIENQRALGSITDSESLDS